jgi:hypothetical protein
MAGYADTKTVESFLEAPGANSGTFADKIADQGPQVQVVNWIWEHVTGENLVEALIAPITGDWARIAANGEAWKNVGNAVEQISGNLSDNVGKLDPYWDGAAAQAFRRHIEVVWFAGLYAEGAVAKTIAKGFGFVADQSERLCQEALDLIMKLVNKLVSAVATFAIPVVGQVRAIKLVRDAYQIYQTIIGIYEAIQATIKAMSPLLEALGNIKSALESIKNVRNLSNLAELGQQLHAVVPDVQGSAVSRPADTWRTAAVERAEARLAEVEVQASAAIAKARSLRIPQTPPLSEDDLRRIEEAARSRDASRELRELQRRIDRGEFTWRDVADGRQMHDPGVRAALGANLDQMARVYHQFEEGYHLDDVIAAHRPLRRGHSGREHVDQHHYSRRV